MCERFPETEKVRVLMAEHAGLRSEITARTGHGFQLAVGTSALVSLIVAAAADKISIPVACGLVAWLSLIFLIGTRFTLREINRAAARIKEIELDVNDRVGEDLLIWEGLLAPGVTGFFWGPAKRKPRSTLKGSPPPERSWRGDPIQ
jgi:hypothetical protein